MRKALLVLLIMMLCLPIADSASSEQDFPSERMSAAGRLAWAFHHGKKVAREEGENTQVAGGQEETTIAVDSTGQHIVVGFNDSRGFTPPNLVSISGFAYSDDGGVTWVDGGQLPTPANDVIDGVRYPQIFGDPDIKYIGACTFIYSSIMIKKSGRNDTIQTLSLHRSTDCGHTWSGPFEITPASQKNRFADKEFLDVDPETGRVIVGWMDFGHNAQVSVAYTDNIMATPPTWSNQKVVSHDMVDGAAPIPRFAGNGSSKVYLAWQRFYSPFPPTFRAIAFSVSDNNGLTWSQPVEVSGIFTVADEVLGVDRAGSGANPGLAVDNSPGPFKGNVYLVYADNSSKDGSDIVLLRSTNSGTTFAPKVILNSRTGKDRSQFMPWVTVDKNTGRVYVMYYDQGIAGGGDLIEVTYLYSDDGGGTWKKPSPLTSRPFHAGYGDDASAPNLGDYIQGVSQNNKLFAAFPGNPPVVGFADGQPTSTAMTVPDLFTVAFVPSPHASVQLGTLSFTDSGGNGFINAGETVTLTVQLTNYDTNPLHASAETGVNALLTTTTPGIAIQQGSAAYPGMSPGAGSFVLNAFTFTVAPAFQPGTRIEFVLQVTTATGTAALPFTLPTGTPVPVATLLSEDFNSVAPGVLPAGWSAVHLTGSTTIPWTTSQSFCTATTNAAFHSNTGSGSRIERLFSPQITIPANAEYVTLEFDVCYDTEDFPFYNVFAYDGMFLRITDHTPGRTLRSVMISSFAEEFTTADRPNYPKHIYRSGDPNHFEMMNAWAGPSGGWQHVRLKLPGMAGSTVQLRFEYTEDAGANCQDVRPGTPLCGVAIDNVVLKTVVSQ